MTVLVHGEAETERAAAAAAALFSEDVAGLDEEMLLEVFADAPSSVLARSDLDGGGLPLVEVLVSTRSRQLQDGGAHGRRPGRRLCEQPPA